MQNNSILHENQFDYGCLLGEQTMEGDKLKSVTDKYCLVQHHISLINLNTKCQKNVSFL